VDTSIWKPFDVVVYVLILVGALNWGLVGLFGFDPVAGLFGEMTIFSRIVYTLVGLAAVYDIVSLPAISRRWHIQVHAEPVHA